MNTRAHSVNKARINERVSKQTRTAITFVRQLNQFKMRGVYVETVWCLHVVVTVARG